MYSKKINQLATNLNPQNDDLIPIGDATTGQLKTTTYNNISGITGDGVISGGIVTWSGSGLIFNISSCTYYLNGIRYTSLATTKTLDAADPTYDRIDVFAVNTNSEVEIIKGTPSINPVEPEGDTSTTLGLTNVTISSGATTPSNVTRDLLYDENVESWTKTIYQNNSTYNYADTAYAYTGTKSILATMGFGFLYFDFSKPTALNISNYDSLTFAIRLNSSWTGNTILAVKFYNGNNAVSNNFQIGSTNNVGFNRNLANQWQLISIPLNNTNLKFTSNLFTRIRIGSQNAAVTYRLDTISLNSGINNPNNQNSANSFGFVNGSTGTATATTSNDTLNIVGSGIATTSATSKTLTITVTDPIPTQTGNTGKFLTTNGSVVSWGTPLDTGITSLNGLTGTTQTFATGTTGTDFGISSASNTHTFNIPTASATNRGALSSSDWSTFNGKQTQLNGTGFVKASGTTITYDNSTYITGNQTITLSGAVTGSGTTAITTTLANSIVGISNLSATGTPSSTTYLRGDNTWATISGGMSIGGSITSATSGSVLFAGTSGVLAQNNANFFWDNTNARLGIGTTSPVSDLVIKKSANAGGRFESTNSANEAFIAIVNSSGEYGSLEIFGSTFANTSLRNTVSFTSSTINGFNFITFNDGSNANFKISTGASTITERFRLFNNTGNVLIQSGGTFTDSGYRLDVNGTARTSSTLTLTNGTIASVADLYVDVQSSGRNIIMGNTSGNTFSGVRNVAIGSVTSIFTTGTGIVQIGRATTTTGNSSVCIGDSSTAAANSIGILGTANIANTIVIGNQGVAKPTASYQFILGQRDIYIYSVNGDNATHQNATNATLNGPGAFGTNVNGGNLSIASGKGTGTGIGGDLIFQTPTIGTTGTTLHTLTERLRIKNNIGSVRFFPISTPATAEAGDVYYDSTSNKLRCYNGTTWNDLF